MPVPRVPQRMAVLPSDEKIPPDAVQLFFAQHFEKISQKDINGILSDYADRVSYFGDTVGREDIREDELADFQKWKDIRQTVTKIEPSSSEQLVFKVCTTNLMANDSKSVKKEVENTFLLIPVGNTFQIKAQSAKVLASEKK